MPTRVESSSGITLSEDFPPLPESRQLTFDEAVWARVAWQYFINNTRPDGLVNAQNGARGSVSGVPVAICWRQCRPTGLRLSPATSLMSASRRRFMRSANCH
nr:DUF3131 domain-containing protein [Cronobacter condimenti]